MPPLRATAPFVGLNTQENESLLAPNEATEALNINLNRGTIKEEMDGAKFQVLRALIQAKYWVYMTSGEPVVVLRILLTP